MRALSIDYGYDNQRNPSSSPRTTLLKFSESQEGKAFRPLLHGQGNHSSVDVSAINYKVTLFIITE